MLKIKLKKREKPINEFAQLGVAFDNLGKAIIEAIEPVIVPVLDWLTKQIQKLTDLLKKL